MKPLIAALVLSLGPVLPCSAEPGPIRVVFSGHRVSVSASDVSAQEVLAEWARAGRAQIDGGQYLAGRRVTLALDSETEMEALAEICGPAFGFGGWAKPGAPPADLSRFARIAIVPAGTPAPPGAASDDLPPEARFSYAEPGHARAATDIVLPTTPTQSPAGLQDQPAPETVFEYWRPGHALPPAADGPFAAGLGPTRQPEPAGPPVDPEARFDYFVPARAVPPRDPKTGATAPPNAGLASVPDAPVQAAPGSDPPPAGQPAR